MTYDEAKALADQQVYGPVMDAVPGWYMTKTKMYNGSKFPFYAMRWWDGEFFSAAMTQNEADKETLNFWTSCPLKAPDNLILICLPYWS